MDGQWREGDRERGSLRYNLDVEKGGRSGRADMLWKGEERIVGGLLLVGDYKEDLWVVTVCLEYDLL